MTTYFKREQRTDGTWFITLAPTAPEWVREAVYAAHGDKAPDDWVYAECESAFEAYQPDNVDWIHVHADARVDVYTAELAQWYADFCLSSIFAEAEELAMDLCTSTDTINSRLMSIQYEAIARICQTISDAIEANE